jgi:hypothetical protein
MIPSNTLRLRHTADPYSFRFFIFCALEAWFLFFWYKTGLPTPAIIGLAIIGYFLATSYFYDNRYSVWAYDETIFMHPAMLWYSPKYVTAIRFSDITSIKPETSDIRTVLAGVRPSRRIAIYADQKAPPNIIDVSFKHFNLDDIRLLLERIKQARPDLFTPSL